MKKQALYSMVECAIIVALATVLSQIKIIHMPFGGSVTLLSMMPIMVFGLRKGFPWSIMCSVLYSIVHLVIDLHEVVSWGLTPASLIACFFLDYILAYSVLGTIGFFKGKSDTAAVGGVLLSLFLRFFVHFLSGVVLWHSAGALWDGFPADNEILYSLVYNGVYMLPEMVFTSIAAFALLRLPQTKTLLRAAA